MKKTLLLLVAVAYAGSALAVESNIIDEKMIIKGGKKSRIEAKKATIPHEFNIDEVLTFDMEPVKDIYYFETSAMHDDTFVKTPDYKPISPLADVKVIDIITREDIKIFKPRQLKHARTWRLSILDVQGKEVNTFYSFDGGARKGIVWDGRNRDNTMLAIGYPYSTVFEWSGKKEKTDPDNRKILWRNGGLHKHTEVGSSFSVNAVFYRDGDVGTIALTHTVLFDREDTVSYKEFSVNENILNQAAVLVQDNYAVPVVINVYGKNKEDALDRARQLQRLLSQKLIVAPDQFVVRGFKAQDNIYYSEIVLGSNP